MLKTTDVGVTGQQYYGAWLSLNVAKNHVHRNFAEQKPITPNSGKKVVMRYYDSLPIADTPLVEGVTPTGSDPVLNEVEISGASYGDYIDVSDEVGLFDRDGQLLINPNSAQNVQLVGEQANDTLDTLARDQMFQGSGVFYAGAPAVDARDEIALANKVAVDDFRMIVRTLMLNKVKPITTMIQASVGPANQPPAAFLYWLRGCDDPPRPDPADRMDRRAQVRQSRRGDARRNRRADRPGRAGDSLHLLRERQGVSRRGRGRHRRVRHAGVRARVLRRDQTIGAAT